MDCKRLNTRYIVSCNVDGLHYRSGSEEIELRNTRELFRRTVRKRNCEYFRDSAKRSLSALNIRVDFATRKSLGARKELRNQVFRLGRPVTSCARAL